MYKPKRILVTGGAGFIGANFIPYFIQKNEDAFVFNIDALTYAASPLNLANIEGHPRYSFIKEDICNQTNVEQLIKEERIDTIVHFAAESHVDRSITDPSLFLKTNVFGTYSLLEAARKIWLNDFRWDNHQCRFHHISTDEVYGSLAMNDAPFSEETPYSPNSPYSASKASSDHFVRAYYETYGLPITLSNCSNNYGPFQHEEKLIPKIILSCLANRPIPIYGQGNNVRDWLYVSDHCEAINTILHHASTGHSYNIGGNQEWSNIDLTNLICKLMAQIMERDVNQFINLIQYVNDRPGHDFRYAINAKKLQCHFNWGPKYVLETGLLNTIQWYLDNCNRYI